ncbi:hypothetical protein ACQCT3_10440 [Sutcliffiella horikoshii]|uniref:hypothetical protein n=1 Tax=Bacillaceae TaxID=186817 RepID=UPI0001E89BA6|nr:hypothetical protein [Bacillus sp. m3-13]
MVYVYLALMGLTYGGYVWLFTYRMSMSEVWLSKSILSPEDSAIIGQLGRWSESLEVIFVLLFVGMMIYCFFKRKTERNIFKKFLLVNVVFVLGIVVFSFIVNQVTSLPIMNLVLPLINLVGIIILLSIFLIIEWFIKYRNIVSRA